MKMIGNGVTEFVWEFGRSTRDLRQHPKNGTMYRTKMKIMKNGAQQKKIDALR